MTSLRHKLEREGYLSLNQFVKYLRLYYPEASVRYPTALRMVKQGKIEANRYGSIWRITRKEIERYAREGNREVGLVPPPEPTATQN